jgi:hypothetical protein
MAVTDGHHGRHLDSSISAFAKGWDMMEAMARPYLAKGGTSRGGRPRVRLLMGKMPPSVHINSLKTPNNSGAIPA